MTTRSALSEVTHHFNRTSAADKQGTLGRTFQRTGSGIYHPPAAPVSTPAPVTPPSCLDVVEYTDIIFRNLERAQNKYKLTPYMANQPEITEKMRAILVDWLVDVHQNFKCRPETLYLAVNIIDRFLSVKSVTKQNLQLVGCVGMLLAAKYEETYPPQISKLVHIAAYTYKSDEMLNMERLILDKISHALTVPTPYPFATRYLHLSNANSEVQQATMFLLESSLLWFSIINHLPSIIAASCIVVASEFVESSRGMTRGWIELVGLSPSELEPCIAIIKAECVKIPTQKLRAVRKKYLRKYPEMVMAFEKHIN